MNHAELVERLCEIVQSLLDVVKRQQYQIEQLGSEYDQDEWEEIERQIRVAEAEVGPFEDWG